MDTVNIILNLCKEKGVTQKQLTDFLGIRKQTVTEWKNGVTNSYNKYLPQISEFFDVSVDYLLGKTEQKKPAAEIGDEQLQECVVLHRDGKTQTYKFTQKQLDLIAEMIEQLGGEEVDL